MIRPYRLQRMVRTPPAPGDVTPLEHTLRWRVRPRELHPDTRWIIPDGNFDTTMRNEVT